MADPVVEIDIRIDGGGWHRAAYPAEQAVRDAAAAALGGYELAPGTELSVLLTDDAAIAALNRRWRDKDGPTNVLSFPGQSPAPGEASALLGDVVIAFETLEAEAIAAAIPPADHLKHLVVHGVLHLLGLDHETAEDADEMEKCEVEILAGLGVPDPYAVSEPVERVSR